MDKKMKASVKASALIHAALKLLDNEIDQHNLGYGQVSDVAQLHRMRESLQEMLNEITNFPPQNIPKKCTGKGWIIIDSWPHSTVLGSSILAAEQAYFDI